MRRILPLMPAAAGRWFLAAVFVAGIALFAIAGGTNYLSVASLEAHRDALVRYAGDHRALALAFAFGIYAAVVALSVPGGLVMSLACGLLFGRVAGTFVAVSGATVGATLVFLAARYLFGTALRKRLGADGERINAGFARHAFNYVLFLRLVPLFPFFLVNLAPAFTSVGIGTYALATLIGILPGTFVYVNLGATLGRLDSLAGALSGETFAALALLGLLALVPVLLRRSRRSRVPEA